ncbi:portal protein [Pseudoalteromonas phage vB_Pun_Y3]
MLDKLEEYEHEYDENSKVDMLSMELERKLTQTINDRAEIDRRMVEDLKNYHGKMDIETISALREAKRSHPFIKLTRAKTNAGESQLVDLLFPNDDKNYGIKPTPMPELSKQLDDETPVTIEGEQYQDQEGNMITQADLAGREIENAKERCESMELAIDDQLIETKYNAKSRQAIHDACVVGTGVLKGPVVMGKLDKAYIEVNGSFQLELRESFTPGVEVVRPWDFFPDLSASEISEAEYTFERRYMSRQAIGELPKRKGFNASNVKRVLKMTAQQTQHTTSYQDDVRKLAGLSDTINDSRYETWEYHGPIDNDVLIEVGAIELPEDEAEALAMIDELSGEETMATVFYCGGIVMGARVHLMTYEGYMPYRVFNWEPDDSSIFGYGIPRMVRDEQGILNTAWRMILDNGAITSGPQIGLNKKHVVPADGDWTITPFKQWNMIGQVDDVRKVFTTVEFSSHLNELQGIYQTARVLFDEVSGVPMLQQGEQGQATQTLGGMSMLMNAANTVRRNQVKDWDDNITEPMISDFYHWNMSYNEDNSIKGDFQVDARGTSALLVKETQAQAISNFIATAGSNPVFAPVLQLKAISILREWAKTQGLPSSVIPTDAELEEYQKQQAEQNEGQPQDPGLMIEQMRQQQQQQKFEFEMQMFERKSQADAQEMQANMQIKQQQLAAEMQAQQSKERVEIMKLSQNEKISSEKMLVELKKAQAKNEQDWAKFTAELKVKQQAGLTANYGLD